jgi:putative transposase
VYESSRPTGTVSCQISCRARPAGCGIKAPPKGQTGFRPIAPLYKVEHAFAQLGRWRRLSRCYEGSEASATTWLKVASVGYLLGRA